MLGCALSGAALQALRIALRAPAFSDRSRRALSCTCSSLRSGSQDPATPSHRRHKARRPPPRVGVQLFGSGPDSGVSLLEWEPHQAAAGQAKAAVAAACEEFLAALRQGGKAPSADQYNKLMAGEQCAALALPAGACAADGCPGTVVQARLTCRHKPALRSAPDATWVAAASAFGPAPAQQHWSFGSAGAAAQPPCCAELCRCQRFDLAWRLYCAGRRAGVSLRYNGLQRLVTLAAKVRCLAPCWRAAPAAVCDPTSGLPQQDLSTKADYSALPPAALAVLLAGG